MYNQKGQNEQRISVSRTASNMLEANMYKAGVNGTNLTCAGSPIMLYAQGRLCTALVRETGAEVGGGVGVAGASVSKREERNSLTCK